MDPGWSDWSGWEWDGSSNCWWRARQDAQGRMEYDYHAPRGGDVEELANSFDNTLHLGGQQDTHYSQDAAYTFGAPNAAEGVAAASGYASSSVHTHSTFPAKAKGTAVDPYSKSKSRDKGSSKKSHRPKHAKGNGNEDAEYAATPDPVNREPFYKKPSTASGHDQATQHAPADLTSKSSPHDSAYSTSPSQGTGTSQFYVQDRKALGRARDASGADWPSAEINDEVESSDPRRDVRGGHISGYGTTVPRSTVAADIEVEEAESGYYSTAQEPVTSDVSNEQLQDAALQANPYMTGGLELSYPGEEPASMATVQDNQYYGLKPDNGRDTPRPFAQQAAAPTMTQNYGYQGTVAQSAYSGDFVPDNEFVLEPSSRFQPGKIFKIVWCEPRGAGPPNAGPSRSEVYTQPIRVEQNGMSFYQGLRRFIVVANDEGHCTCVPILTYERQACNKRGVKPSKHGIIYQAGHKPRMLSGEPQLGFDPVRVNLYERTERLVKESRVNYAKLTTVEHNFRVLFIGSVDQSDFQNIVVPAVDACWQRKRRH